MKWPNHFLEIFGDPYEKSEISYTFVKFRTLNESGSDLPLGQGGFGHGEYGEENFGQGKIGQGKMVPIR